MLEQSAASSALTEKNLAEQISWIILFLIQSPTQGNEVILYFRRLICALCALVLKCSAKTWSPTSMRKFFKARKFLFQSQNVQGVPLMISSVLPQNIMVLK